jgi:protein-S-isoprenylcysteine O-methyltransferase Ste14
MNQHRQIPSRSSLCLVISMRMISFAVALFWPAGTWQWWEAWVLIALWTAFAVSTAIYLARHDPDLLAERMKSSPVQKGQKTWDKILLLLFFILGFGIYIIPGFDVVRYGWSEPLPVWAEMIAMFMHVPGFIFIAWVMQENTFLARVVKIDDERGQQVITTGPYALVRHPMYSAVIVLIFAMPLALGSRYGLIPAAIAAVLLIVRTYLEDRTLYKELPGYPEYSKQTPYRLLPGVW